MARKAGAGTAASSQTVRYVSDLLRHLEYPRRLQHNELARRYFPDIADLTADPGAGDLAARRIRTAVEAALAQLTPRRRAIVERCDLQHESHESVIADLAVSESYFYRERRQALQAIAQYLRAASPDSEPRATIVDPFEAALSQATVLAQVGCVDRAIAELRRLSSDVADPASKVVALCHLTEVAAHAGLTAASISDAGAAEQFVEARCADDELLRALAWTARALALRVHGDEVNAARIARQAHRVLLGQASKGVARARIAEAIVTNGIVLAERSAESGNVAAAVATTDEMAMFANNTDGVRPVVRIRAALYQMFAHGYPQPNPATIAGLERLLAKALEGGLTAQAGTIASMLSSLYRLAGQSRTALTHLLPLMDLFRRVPMGEAFGYALLQLAAAFTEVGDGARALPLLEEARHIGPAGAYIHAASFVYEAHTQLQLHNARAAIEASRFAIDYCRRLDRPVHLGRALWLGALALEQSGDLAGARSCIKESADILETCYQPRLLASVRKAATRIGTMK